MQSTEVGPVLGPLHDLAVADPVQALRAITALRHGLADAEALAVTLARTRGMSWRELGPPLGKSWSAVYDCYRRLDRPSRPARAARPSRAA